MDKRLIIVIPVIIILIIFGFMIYQKTRTGDEKNDYYTIEPEPWIEDTKFDDNPTDVVINVRKATRSESSFDIDRQEYYHDGLKTLFSSGIYEGFPFGSAHMANSTTVISIGPEMDPGDGIIDGFILGKYEKEDFVFYVFLDEDWREQIEYTNILYANDLDDPEITEFDFSEPEKGIYVNKVKGEFDWFTRSPRAGGIYVGELTLDTLEIDDLSSTSLTFIYVR